MRILENKYMAAARPLAVRIMAITADRVDEAFARLRKLGLRLTPQRMAIAKTVLYVDTHPTAEEVYQSVRTEYPTLSLATVYSTLDTLVRAGLLQAINTREMVRFDSNPSQHINLICLNCSKIVDVDDEVMSGVAQRKAEKFSFHIVNHQYMVYGYCEDCRSEVP
jgi:Fur family peroxide stress response transcriptional regulator